MPSSHRRIGLIVDEPVGTVLHLFRERADATVPDARIARLAVLEGALVEALVKVAASDATERERAAELVAGVRELVPDLPLTGQVKDELLRSLSRADARPSLGERRRRQFELLRNAQQPEDGQTAQNLADTFDAFERPPAP